MKIEQDFLTLYILYIASEKRSISIVLTDQQVGFCQNNILRPISSLGLKKMYFDQLGGLKTKRNHVSIIVVLFI